MAPPPVAGVIGVVMLVLVVGKACEDLPKLMACLRDFELSLRFDELLETLNGGFPVVVVVSG